MAGLCKATIVGNLGRDPEKRYTQDGRAVTRFSVAATTRRKDREGNWTDFTQWFNVTVFGRPAETLAERLAKGGRVYVEGRLESREYEREGGKGFAMDIIASEVIPLDSRPRDGDTGPADFADDVPAADAPRAAGAARAGTGRAPADEPADLEDLPF